ncbi:MAG: pyridoxamine 5'-phosphate oxidase family protein [Gammaproteobacteria bacterium]
MIDLKNQIDKILSENSGLISFATITKDGKPWVRYVSTIYDPKDTSIRFSTFLPSRKVEQIKNNPEVHLTCGVMDPEKPSNYLQIQGTAIFTQDKAEREAFWNEHIVGIFKGVDDPNYGVVIVKPYLIELYEIGSFVPKIWKRS